MLPTLLRRAAFYFLFAQLASRFAVNVKWQTRIGKCVCVIQRGVDGDARILSE